MLENKHFNTSCVDPIKEICWRESEKTLRGTVSKKMKERKIWKNLEKKRRRSSFPILRHLLFTWLTLPGDKPFWVIELSRKNAAPDQSYSRHHPQTDNALYIWATEWEICRHVLTCDFSLCDCDICQRAAENLLIHQNILSTVCKTTYHWKERYERYTFHWVY